MGIYYYDKIRTNLITNIGTLKNKLPTKELKKECRSFKILWAYESAKKWGYKSRIKIVAPKRKFFKILKNYENVLGHYKISYLEIAKAIHFPSPGEAGVALLNIRKKYTKKWCKTHKFYRQKDEDENRINDGLWGDETIYIGDSRKYLFMISRHKHTRYHRF